MLHTSLYNYINYNVKYQYVDHIIYARCIFRIILISKIIFDKQLIVLIKHNFKSHITLLLLIFNLVLNGKCSFRWHDFFLQVWQWYMSNETY